MRGAIADDFTGATDLAGNWRARGLRTAVVLGVPGPDELADLADHDAVVVALKIRSAPAPQAVEQARAAYRALAALGVTQVYDKYCSTFDSTPEGNIGPVADALMEETGARSAVVVPGFPDAGRTVFRGHLFVGDDPLDRSPMKDHPLNPMWDSRVANLLAAQTAHPVAEVPVGVVRAGEQALRGAIVAAEAGGARYVVVDSIDNDDLAVVARATSDAPLVTGGSGLALGLDPTGATLGDITAVPGRRAVLAGSASRATQAQVRGAMPHLPHQKVDVAAALADPDAEVERLLAWARERWAEQPDRPVLVYSVGEPDDVARGRAVTADASAVVERLFSALAPRLAEAGATQLVVAGGETSGSVVQGLGVHVLEVGQLLSPGVSWLRGRRRGADDVNLVLKSGNFGTEDLFVTAWEELA
ncbi:3-oxo-tetronate kinase [Cellulosimicrobium sp. TH-20]|uniref:3-oxo-tetronate kinase n=1 Tax=unclassified Cellulosimicrobium TaxID=2624466 RepID=UPI0015844143